MKRRRLISLMTVIAIFVSSFANLAVFAENEDASEMIEITEAAETEAAEAIELSLPETDEAIFAEPEEIPEEADIELFADGDAVAFTVDFTKSEAATYEATTTPVSVNDYVNIYFTHGGSIDATNGVSLLGGNGGKGKYTAGSYIEFTAPADGVFTFSGSAVNYYTDGTYTSYGGSATINVTAGTKYQLGQRTTTYVKTISYTPTVVTPTPEATEAPEETEAPVMPAAYSAPTVTWDFTDYGPASGGKNMPYVTGNTEYSDGEIKFPSGTTAGGAVSVDFDAPIAHSASYNSAAFTFDVIGHDTNLGQQYYYFSIANSEGVELVRLQCHPYDSTVASYVTVCGTDTGAAESDIKGMFLKNGLATITVSIDFNAGKVAISSSLSSTVIDAELPEDAAKDIAKFTFGVSRSKTAPSRYISIDNIKVAETKSTAQAFEPTITEGYTEKTLGGLNSRVKAPAGDNLPLLIYLCGSSRFGTDNYSQLYNSQHLFALMDGKAILAAPQTTDGWDASQLKEYISAAKEEYDPTEVIVAGQFEGADAAYMTAGYADKIIPIAGTSDITSSKARVWAFGGFLDDVTPIADIRKPVNALQQAKADVRYTEYPTDGHAIAEKAAAEDGLSEWILSTSHDKKIVDLVLFSGQSNMAGRGSANGNEKEPAAVKCPSGYGYEFHSITNPSLLSSEVPYALSTVSEPFGKNDNNYTLNDAGSNGIDRRSGDMVSSLMKEYYEETGVPIVGVQASRGGQESSFFVNASINAEMLARYNAAETYLKASGYTIRRKFMVWVQGEADADKGRSESAYKNNTLKVFSNMQSAGITDMFIVKTGHYNINYNLSEGASPSADALALDEKYKQVNTWQQDIADENANIYTVADLYTDEFLARMRDQYHFYQDVYNTVGATAGGNIAKAYDDNSLDVSKFELTSSDEVIDVSGLTNYGSNVYRIYKRDKSYVDVTATDGKVTKPAGESEVTVVPVYRFNYTNAAMDGYTTATGVYSKEAGYGTVSDVNYNTTADGSLPISGRPLIVDVPEGRYDISILRKNATRINTFNDGVKIITNDGVGSKENRDMSSAYMYAPQILCTDGSIDITTDGGRSGKERITTMELVRVPEKYKKHIVWISGDSESASYYPIDLDGDDLQSNKLMQTGFGQQLQRFLPDNEYRVSNHGEPSSTVVTWYNNHFDGIYQNMDEGDIIIVDFGINDAVSSSNKLSVEAMEAKMKEIFEASEAKGVQPILVSPVMCGKYQSKSYFTYNTTTSQNAMYAFAAECGVPCIDLNKGGQLYAAATNVTDWAKYNYYVDDNLHQTQFAALMNAAIIAGGMKELGYDTTDYSYTYKDISAFGFDEGTENENDMIRGTESGVTREYSIAALKDYVTVMGEITKPAEPVVSPTAAPTAEPTSAPTVIPTAAPSTEETPKPTAAPMSGAISVEEDKTVTVTISNISDAVLIRARYDGNGALMSMNVYDDLTFNEGTAQRQISDLQNGDVLYLWDSIRGMKPLCEKKAVAGLKAEPTANPTEPPKATDTPAATETPGGEEPQKPEIIIPSEAVAASDLIYSFDYESATVGESKAGKNNYLEGWYTPAGSLSVAQDTSNASINKYILLTGNGKNRSAYMPLSSAVTDSFVFEADFKSTAGSIASELQLVKSTGDINENHGVKNTSDYVFTMDRPKNSNLYVINNGTSFDYLSLNDYNQPAVVSDEFLNDPWLHVKVVGDYAAHTVTAYITSLDGNTIYYYGKNDMSSANAQFGCVHMLAPGETVGIDNVKIYKARTSDLAPVYHKVTIKSGGNEFSQYVYDKDFVKNIPDVSLYGSSFEGWKADGKDAVTSAQLAKTPITADTVYTAQISSSYIEGLSSVEFNDFPTGGELVMGTDENTYGDNPISLNILGELGTSLVTSPDARVTDYKVEWSFDGFRILNAIPTGETGSVYCDSYGLCEVTETAQTSVNFKLKKTAANYYGRVTAKVTYNGRTKEVSAPLVLLADKSASYILPKAGYSVCFEAYDDALVGANTADSALLLGGWAVSGSESPTASIATDGLPGKFLRIERTGTNTKRSSYAYQNIGNITGHTIFGQVVRFSGDGVIRYAGGTDTSPASVAFEIAKYGSDLSLNNTVFYSGMEANQWYDIAVMADPTSKKVFAFVSDMLSNRLGTSEVMPFKDADYSGGIYYSIAPPVASTIDLYSVKIHESEIDASTINITGSETASIPDSGTNTVTFSATAKTVDQYDSMGAVTWAIDDEIAEGVSINSDGVLTITPDASSGNLPIKATIGGKSKTTMIKLTGTKNSIAFTSAPLGIELGKAGIYEYTAELRNGQAEKIEGAVTYLLADASGAVASYAGVEINASTGELSVSESAQPQTIYVKASSGDYSRLAKTTLYGLKFSFGTAAAASGYTQVLSSAAYSEARGFGFEGGATDEASDVTGSGAVFKVKLEKGRVYTVKAKYNGTIRCERVNATFTGFEKTLSTMGEETYNVAVFGDDVMDITLTSGAQLASVEITPVTKTKTALPSWWTVGDSTIQQNPSWAYRLASVGSGGKDTAKTTAFTSYPKLDGVISTFYNSGKAGRNHRSYYSEGILNSVLCGVNPGDVISLSGMGVNDSSASKEQFYAYHKLYVDAMLDMGAYVIIGSYTPSGNYGATKGKVYDADAMTFKGMRTDAYDLAIRDLYEDYKNNDHVLGFIDIGAKADEMMTADVKKVYTDALAAGKTDTEARGETNAKADEMMLWWKDYNHYYDKFSDYILPFITESAAELIKTINN